MKITVPSPEQEITLWTIQDIEFWQASQKKGVLRCDGRKSIELTQMQARPQYQWMKRQMAKRVEGYTGRYPIWAWYYPKPDLREQRHWYKGEMVIIEFKLKAARALLSDHELWHIPLNRGYVSLTEKEDKAFDRKVKKLTGRDEFWHLDLLPEELRQEVFKSWERIFDFDLLNLHADKKWNYKVRYVQAVTEEVRLEQIVSVRPFTGTSKSKS
jgi:hypothetical protein